MKYTNEKIIERFESGENLKYVLFWGHQKTNQITKSCFSQWYESPFDVNGVIFQTAEHYMMAEKALLFNDIMIYNQIIETNNAAKAKKLGREIKNFNQRVWEENRFEIVVRGNFHKFSQNPELYDFLKNTKERILVEASPVDNIWGIGIAKDTENSDNPYFWDGLNLLGYALMETRDILSEIVNYKKLDSPLLPPWLEYPQIDRFDLGWRMGEGEKYLVKLSNYFEQLSNDEKITYQMTFPEREGWKDWYKE